MSRKFSIGALAIIAICSIGIGISGFTSFQYNDRTPANYSQHLKEIIVEDLGMFKYRTDTSKPNNKLAYNYPTDEGKPKNKKFQLIHWNEMDYFNRF